MNDKTVLLKNENMAVRVIDEETVLMPIFGSTDKINSIFTLNKVGSRIWSLINGKRTVGEIKEQLSGVFTVTPARLNKEVAAFLQDLKKINAVTLKKT